MNSVQKRKRFLLIGYLGQGILPFEQWACVFSNPDLHCKPGLICKAFTVWFPTMHEFLSVPSEVQEVINDTHETDLDEIKVLISKLQEFYRYFLCLYSRDEQIFINDRRLQNVHGVLSIFRLEKVHIKYFDSASGKINKEHIDAEEYHKIMRQFYPQMRMQEMELRNKLVTDNKFPEFGNFYNEKLKIEPYLIELARKVGVYSNA